MDAQALSLDWMGRTHETMTENMLLLDMFPWAPRPLIVLALIVGAMAAAVIVHSALWAVFRRFIGARYPLFHDIVQRTFGISRFAFIMVAFSIIEPLAPFSPTVLEHVHRI